MPESETYVIGITHCIARAYGSEFGIAYTLTRQGRHNSQTEGKSCAILMFPTEKYILLYFVMPVSTKFSKKGLDVFIFTCKAIWCSVLLSKRSMLYVDRK